MSNARARSRSKDPSRSDATGQNPNQRSGSGSGWAPSSAAGRTAQQKGKIQFEQDHTSAPGESRSRTGGGNYSYSSSTTRTNCSSRTNERESLQFPAKAGSYAGGYVAQLQAEKEQLERQVDHQTELIQAQLQREEGDQKQLAEAHENQQLLGRELQNAQQHAAQIQKEAESRIRSQEERFQEELAKMQTDMRRQHDEYENRLQAVQSHLKQEQETRRDTEYQLAQLRSDLEEQKARSKQIVERCLSRLRSSKDGHGVFHGHLGISFESPQQERKYQAIALKIIDELQPNATITVGAQPDGLYDIVFHLARTEGGRTVNLKPSIRQQFKCDNVILVLLRSGKNPDVYSTFLPRDANEYSGILFGQKGERRVMVQFLHWENEWVDCKLNEENVKLLRDLVSQARPRMLEKLQEDQLLKALGLQKDR